MFRARTSDRYGLYRESPFRVLYRDAVGFQPPPLKGGATKWTLWTVSDLTAKTLMHHLNARLKNSPDFERIRDRVFMETESKLKRRIKDAIQEPSASRIFPYSQETT